MPRTKKIKIGIYVLVSKRCRLPVCDKKCEQGDLHQLECDVFSAVISYHETYVANKGDKNEGNKSQEDGGIKPEEIEQLIKTFQISKLDSPSPAYACITPLRMLLKYRKEMTKETMKIRDGEKTKDEVDVSDNSKKYPQFWRYLSIYLTSLRSGLTMFSNL